MRRKRGLSGQKGSTAHWSKAGMKVKPSRKGHIVEVPMISLIPKIYRKKKEKDLQSERLNDGGLKIKKTL